MNLEKYKLLKNKRIVEVLDGDETFGDFERHNTGSYFGVGDLKIAMPRLSGQIFVMWQKHLARQQNILV